MKNWIREKIYPMSEEKIKILVVDDHPLIREGLSTLINREQDMMVIGEAGTAQEALQKIQEQKPDFIIVDISLTGISGLDLTKNILLLHPDMPILVISLYEESLYLDRVLKAGAKGYLMKQEATEKFVPAIRKILKGEVYVSDKAKEGLVNQLANSSATSSLTSPSETLSDRELEVLQLIAQAHATRQIAEMLHVSVKTVESHYANIKTKLGLKNSHELIQFAVKWDLMQKK